ncbi:protein lin-54 homolog [Euwallacea similis]|uniref:protein lin-54 homolog n=1 Tax=Euwallacea similis TaxID=1736056 RepID=UPI003450DBC1
MSLTEQEESGVPETLTDNSSSEVENIENMAILEEYPDDIALQSNEMEVDENLEVEDQGDVEHEEEIVQTEDEIESQEIEIQSDDQIAEPEEVIEKKYKPHTTVPPLRLLNIAPKPEQVPLAMKSVPGQPLLLVPGSGGGQAIKLVGSQGQEINLANYSLGRPITIKQSGKTTMTTGPTVLHQTQPKQIFMKKIITTTTGQKTITKPIGFAKPGQQFVMVHKSSGQPQQIKVMSSSGGTSNKTITLQQAQEMGILGNAKILQTGVQQIPSKRTVLINKAQPKAIKLVSQGNPTQVISTGGNFKTISLGQVKSPTKILPAGVSTLTGVKGTQRLILKSSSGSQVLSAGQLIQVAGTQGLSNGQIHQINVPGKGVQYIKFVPATTAEASNPAVTLVNTVKTASPAAVSASMLPDVKPVITTTKFVTKPVTPGSKPTQYMLFPAGYLPATMQQVQKVGIPAMKQSTTQSKQSSASVVPKPLPPDTSPSPETGSNSTNANIPVTTENQTSNANGIRPRKPCNCTKSQCLKLYCDCFANGEFCYLCNCVNCFNNLENEDTRNLAIKACLERNPNAFRPKIGKAKDTTGDVLRKHTKGCNCKRSGCLKNYCECYEAKIACSSNCKCRGCRNVEDAAENRHLESISNTQRINDEELSQAVYKKILPYYKEMSTVSPVRHRKSSLLRKQPVTYITDEVIEATCQCLLTIADEADSNVQDEELTKRQIIEEFGGCLNEIIHCSLNRGVS